MSKNGNGKVKEVNFENYNHLVPAVVHNTNIRLPQCMEICDLYQIGYIVLLKTLEKYDPNKYKNGNGFGSYAFYMIRFGIIDELRKLTHIKRNRNKGDEHKNSFDSGIFLEQRFFCRTKQGEYEDLIDFVVDKDGLNPEEELIIDYDTPIIIQEINDKLTDRESIILELYTRQKLVLSEVADMVGISESRASQIFKVIKEKIKPIIIREGAKCQHPF